MENIQIGDSNSGEGSSSSSLNDEVVAIDAALGFDTLPVDCISKVISQTVTSPRDACVVASVSKAVKSAAESDLVWEKFLPLEYLSLVSRSLNSKKEIYMSLAEESVLIDEGKKSLWLDKANGNKCYMISVMDLTITWGDSSAYWQWISVPESKFEKVAELLNVCWFKISGKISSKILSKASHYSVYLVFKRANNISHGVNFVGKEANNTLVYLEHVGIDSRYRRTSRVWTRISRGDDDEGEKEKGRNLGELKERRDGWSEVELGRFYNNGDCEDEIEISVVETKMGRWKSGLIIQGIEIRASFKKEI